MSLYEEQKSAPESQRKAAAEYAQAAEKSLTHSNSNKIKWK